MQTNNSSQCQLFQLHIDAYLDDELEPSRVTEFNTHLAGCESCRRELAYAEQLHRAVVSLPILDCSDSALEPVDRLFRAGGTAVTDNMAPVHGTGSGFRAALAALLDAIPAPVRIGVPVAAVLLLAVGVGRQLPAPGGDPGLAVQPAGTATQPQYTEAEVVKAMQDLELALDYLGQVSARTEVLIEDRFLHRQLRESINASLSTDLNHDPQATGSDGPI
ncbi:MAG: zf-HC2 domain-containing protein [Gammaproteobacteria bacterium]|nr:zf-HC2 domain-containing protein [Pseudomonadales bacterium]MCP5346719.1 zf-HC2 domain-containing protein [Pseudomonadales bacterium]